MLVKLLPFIIIITITGCQNPAGEKMIHRENSQKGAVLFNNTGCTMCHSITGGKLYGPPLDSVLNTRILVISNGKQDSATIDRSYIIRSIKDPEFEKDIRYQRSKMPKPDLSDDDIESIADFLIMINSR